MRSRRLGGYGAAVRGGTMGILTIIGAIVVIIIVLKLLGLY